MAPAGRGVEGTLRGTAITGATSLGGLTGTIAGTELGKQIAGSNPYGKAIGGAAGMAAGGALGYLLAKPHLWFDPRDAASGKEQERHVNGSLGLDDLARGSIAGGALGALLGGGVDYLRGGKIPVGALAGSQIGGLAGAGLSYAMGDDDRPARVEDVLKKLDVTGFLRDSEEKSAGTLPRFCVIDPPLINAN